MTDDGLGLVSWKLKLTLGVAVGAGADGDGVCELGLGREGELALDSGLAVRQPTTTTPRGVNSLGSDGGERSLGVAYLVVVASVNQRSREDDLVRLGPGGEIKPRGRGEMGCQFDRDVLRWYPCRRRWPRPPHVVIGWMARTCMSPN